MSKKSASERRAAVERLAAEQRRGQRTRGFAVVGLSVLVAVAIIGSALWFGSAVPYASRQWYDEREFRDVAVDQIGAPASACGSITTRPATGNQEHVAEGTQLSYLDAPPAFGKHYPVWESMDRKFYSAADRPPLGKLVHNLEHGYTVVWYDETAAADPDMLAQLEGIASKYRSTTNMRMKLKVAPWLADDGGSFPTGQHVAFTHWSAGGVGTGQTGEQVGVWQYCTAPSGAALKAFMTAYPYLDSPEPNAM